MKALVIDDETHCVNAMRKLIKEHCKAITDMHEARDVDSGLEKILSIKPDIVFLDIQLNDRLSFEILDQLDEINFQIIFTTAYDNYACKAFEYAAIHYLLKPIIPSDLIKAIDRCEKKELHYDKKKLAKTKGFYLKTRENTYNLIYNQIVYIKADGSYSTIYNEGSEKVFTSKKLGDYKEILNEDFFRIHNSIIVNLNFVEDLDKKETNIVLMNGEKLPLSRRKKAEFKKIRDNFLK